MCKDRLIGLSVCPSLKPPPRARGRAELHRRPHSTRLCGEKSGGAFQPGDPVYQLPLALVQETSSRSEWVGVSPPVYPANGAWMSALRLHCPNNSDSNRDGIVHFLDSKSSIHLFCEILLSDSSNTRH